MEMTRCCWSSELPVTPHIGSHHNQKVGLRPYDLQGFSKMCFVNCELISLLSSTATPWDGELR